MEEFLQFLFAWKPDGLDVLFIIGIFIGIYAWMGIVCLNAPNPISAHAYGYGFLVQVLPICFVAFVAIIITLLLARVSDYMLQDRLWGYVLSIAGILYFVPKVTNKIIATETSQQ